MTTMSMTFTRRAPESWGAAEMFYEVADPTGQYSAPLRAEICIAGMANYVSFDIRTKNITLVASDQETPECFDIRQCGTLGDVINYLDCDLRRWLRKTYRAGCRFVQVEIGR